MKLLNSAQSRTHNVHDNASNDNITKFTCIYLLLFTFIYIYLHRVSIPYHLRFVQSNKIWYSWPIFILLSTHIHSFIDLYSFFSSSQFGPENYMRKNSHETVFCTDDAKAKWGHETMFLTETMLQCWTRGNILS